jgi:hypothetical protein
MKTKWSLLIVLALLIPLVSGVTPALAQSETTYSISGQVFYDDNGNGILDGESNSRISVRQSTSTRAATARSMLNLP